MLKFEVSNFKVTIFGGFILWNALKNKSIDKEINSLMPIIKYEISAVIHIIIKQF